MTPHGLGVCTGQSRGRRPLRPPVSFAKSSSKTGAARWPVAFSSPPLTSAARERVAPRTSHRLGPWLKPELWSLLPHDVAARADAGDRRGVGREHTVLANPGGSKCARPPPRPAPPPPPLSTLVAPLDPHRMTPIGRTTACSEHSSLVWEPLRCESREPVPGHGQCCAAGGMPVRGDLAGKPSTCPVLLQHAAALLFLPSLRDPMTPGRNLSLSLHTDFSVSFKKYLWSLP